MEAKKCLWVCAGELVMGELKWGDSVVGAFILCGLFIFGVMVLETELNLWFLRF